MDEKLPPGIGPHEGRELELMLAGKKPLAMFNDDWPAEMEPPEIIFDPYVALGRFVKLERFVPTSAYKNGQLHYYYYALPGEEWRITRMIEIQRRITELRLPTTPELEIETGQLLGYDEADIQVFVNRWFGPDRKRILNNYQ
jgi:hypothetical protein